MRSAVRARGLRGFPVATPTTPTTPLHPALRRVSAPAASASCSYFHSKSWDSSAEGLGAAAKLPDAEPVAPVTPRQRVTVADIAERRTKAGRLVAPTAAYSDADMFKAPVGNPNPGAYTPLTPYLTPIQVNI